MQTSIFMANNAFLVLFCIWNLDFTNCQCRQILSYAENIVLKLKTVMHLLTLTVFFFLQDREATWHGIWTVFFRCSVWELVGDVNNKCSSVCWLRVAEAPDHLCRAWLEFLQTSCFLLGERDFFFFPLISETPKRLCAVFTIGFLLFLFLLFSFLFFLLIIVKYMSKI